MSRHRRPDEPSLDEPPAKDPSTVSVRIVSRSVADRPGMRAATALADADPLTEPVRTFPVPRPGLCRSGSSSVSPSMSSSASWSVTSSIPSSARSPLPSSIPSSIPSPRVPSERVGPRRLPPPLPPSSAPRMPLAAPIGPAAPRRGSGPMIAVVAVLMVLVAALGVGLVRPDLVGLAGAPLFGPAGEAPPGSAPAGGPSTVAVAPAGTASTVDPSTALRQQADADRADLLAATGSWVPQLSSKRPGTVDDGRTYDAAAILAEHQQLRARYPQARLLWSGDWPVFDAGDYWVTVLADPWPSASGANAWCDAAGFATDRCFAKRLLRTGGSGGTTIHR